MIDETPCHGNPGPYDILIDPKPSDTGRVLRKATRDAYEMCAQCPVRLRCFTIHADEDWVKRLTRQPVPNPPTTHPQCGSPRGYSVHKEHHEAACLDCKEAAAARSRAQRAARRARRSAA